MNAATITPATSAADTQDCSIWDAARKMCIRDRGYIAYKLPKEKMSLKTMWPIACGMLHNSTVKRLLQFGIAIKRGGSSLQDRMDKEKKPYIFVGLVCVREQYQGQGYMRKMLDLAFAEGCLLYTSVRMWSG